MDRTLNKEETLRKNFRIEDFRFFWNEPHTVFQLNLESQVVRPPKSDKLAPLVGVNSRIEELVIRVKKQ